MISPWVVGQTRPSWQIAWTDNRSNAIDLTGATVVVLFNSGSGSVPGAGNVSVTNAKGGLLTYAPATADTPAQGNYQVQLKATYTDGTILYSLQQPFVVNPAV